MRWQGHFVGVACLLTAGTGLVACKSTPSATLTITTGEETDAFSRSPVPTTLIVDRLGLDGKATEIARATLPTDEISLGDDDRAGVGAFRVTGVDPAGNVLLKGESLFVQFGALEDTPLEIFVQRTGELARLPRAPLSLEAPRLAVTVARYVLAASGTAAFLYDLLLLKPTAALPAFPRPARSLATFGTTALVIDEQGATGLDLSAGTATDLTAPAGGTFAEIAGGLTTVAPDGTIYIVGGTRATGGPSQRVLTVSTDGIIAFATLAVPREGACAAWVEGRGVVVYGGALATDPAAELLAPSAVQAAKLAYAGDAVKGCGAAALDASHVLVAGGTGSPTDMNGAAQARVVDLACASDCSAAPWPGALPLVRAEAITLAPGAALLVGDDAGGVSHAFRASSAGAREIALKVPRHGARLVALPVQGTAAIFGGAPAIEHYAE